MKLCIVTPKVAIGDGQGRVNYEVAWEAIRRGHHVTLLASSVDLALQQHSQVDWISIPVKGYPLQLVREIAFSTQSAWWLNKHQKEFDLIKLNGAITSARGDVNAVHFVHSSWLRSPVNRSEQHSSLRSIYNWFYTTLNADWEKKAFSQAKVIVAVSKQVERELVEIGVPPECIRVILNGVDLQEFSPGEAKRQTWGLPEGVTLALFAGNAQTPRKNLDTVIRALAQVPELQLVVAGTTTGTTYPQLVASLDLSKRVHFLEHRSDVPELMKAVDLLVFPSRYEPFGLVVIEAMAAGLPVITAATTGAAEIITPECGIVLSEPDDIQALARALSLLTSHQGQRHQMGQAARTIAQQYSWTSMAQTYVDLFEELSKL
ncbi:glycosyltransferase family 4 protein [Microcoleus sp. OTE_8_concoct_300]|uniref:glycosyltransferase family 4 protein n=1 Tax=Microcoleus sp. OTE_8_concoct_300 TaxID=2964710 RepID=UPI00403FB369